jgi:hypothetical protein
VDAGKKDYLFKDRERLLKLRQMQNKPASENYGQTIEDEMSIFDEECRILKDWLTLGGVSVHLPENIS